jgi:hypothetical protein
MITKKVVGEGLLKLSGCICKFITVRRNKMDSVKTMVSAGLSRDSYC